MKNLTNVIIGSILGHVNINHFVSPEILLFIRRETEYHIRYSSLTRVRYAISSQMRTQL